MNRHRALKRTVLGISLAAAVVAVVGVGTATSALAAPTQGDLRGSGVPGAIKDSYIVVLKNQAAGPAGVKAAASSLSARFGGQVGRTFSHAVRGFAIRMPEAKARQLAARPDVAYVEQSRTFKKSGVQPNPPSWGLDRLDETALPLDRSYTYAKLGSSTRAYVLDTGIDITHTAFEGRASHGFDFIDNDPNADDCNNHGTHVAGTIGSETHGVAKDVKLVAVRVLDCEGFGTTEQVIAGIDWVTANAVKPAVANMSLGGSKSDALDAAVTASIASGLPYTVAAGNADAESVGGDACTQSPAGVPGALTVAATDRTDMRVRFSYVGPCVDIFAPGHGIVSTIRGNAFDTFAGTSMAAPHVAGAIALLYAYQPTMTPAQVRTALFNDAVNGRLGNVGVGTPNRLLHINGKPVPAPISLQSKANSKHVRASATSLIADRLRIQYSEQFDAVDAGGGLIALKARFNGRYLTAPDAGASPLVASSTTIGTPEKFTLITNADSSVSLLASVNGKYVSAPAGGTGALIASQTVIGTPEKFNKTTTPRPVITLLALGSGMYVTAESAGAAPLIANRSTAGAWQKFDILHTAGGTVTLRTHANNKYVTAENAGTSPLIARSTSGGAWQQYEVIHLGGAEIALRATVNNRFVTAYNAATPLIADQTLIWFENVFVLDAVG